MAAGPPDAAAPWPTRPVAEGPGELAELRLRLEEAEDTLRALRNGEVDAIVVGDDVFTLEGAEATANRFRGDVLAQMEDAVVALDSDDHVVFINPAAERQYGLPASQALGLPRQQLFRQIWLKPEDQAAARQALGETGLWRGRTVHRTRAGVRLPVDSTLSQLHDASGAVCGLLMVVRDVSEQAAAEAALREADQRKDVFLATLAHELRNPLAPIRNSVQLLRLSGEPRVHEKALSTVEKQLDQLVHLVDDLLDVSRISRGQLELRRGLIDIDAALQNAIDSTRPQIERRRHRLVLELPAEPLVVEADMTRVTQIVANLLDNAAKYTPDGGRITLRAEAADGMVLLTVEDNGIGIPAAMLPRVFDLFTQVNRSLERSHGGLGIGLALVRRLAELHGGRVDAASDGEGRGTRVVVRLPGAPGAAHSAPAATTTAAAAAMPAPAVDQPAAAESAAPVAGCRVLIVEDNRDSAESMAMLLQLMGHEAVVADDGEAAVREAAAFRPQVVLMDIGLPGVDGYEAARRIRAGAGGSAMLLIALTGWGQDGDRDRSRRAGLDHHLVKPVDPDRLMHLLASAPKNV